MPEYSFACDCGEARSVFCSIAERPKELNCLHCGKKMYRTYQICATGGKLYRHPIHSDSLAISPSQVQEHRKLFPGVKLDSECRPVFENFRQHDNYLKKTGFVKHSKKIKPKGIRLKSK